MSIDYKEKLLEIVKWLDSQELKDKYGIKWRYNDSDEAVEYYTNEENFNSGSSGMIPYLLTVYDVTEDKKYLDKAVDVGDRLIVTKDTKHVRELGNHLVGAPWSIYGGLPGEAATAIMLYEKTGEERFRTFALSVARDIVSDAKKTANGVAWLADDMFGVGGDAGTLAALVYYAKHLKVNDFDDTIRKAAYQLLTYGKEDTWGGKIYPDGISLHRLGATESVEMVGLEFGTAGISWVLAECAEYLDDDTLLAEAEACFRHVTAVSEEVGENAYAARVYSNEKVYYLGNCMGSAGIIKSFYKLYKVTGKQIYKDWIDKYVNGILAFGAPKIRSAGYWNNACVCCGTGSLARLFVALWAEFKDDTYLELAKDAVDTMIGQGFNDDNRGLRWYQAFERVSPWKVHTHTGFMCGNAGSATALAEYYLATRRKFHAYRFIEDPLPEK